MGVPLAEVSWEGWVSSRGAACLGGGGGGDGGMMSSDSLSLGDHKGVPPAGVVSPCADGVDNSGWSSDSSSPGDHKGVPRAGSAAPLGAVGGSGDRRSSDSDDMQELAAPCGAVVLETLPSCHQCAADCKFEAIRPWMK